MGWGVERIFTKTMAGGATQTTLPFDLGQTYERVYLQIPTMASAANISVDASADAGVSYYQVRHSPNPLTATVLTPTFIVAASASANGAIVPVPAGFRYMRLTVDSSPTAAYGFKIICGN